MRIGIDATALPARLFGAGNHIVNLIQALPQVNPAHQYIVFAKSPHASLFESFESVQVVRVPLSFRVQRIAWEQIALPRLVQRHDLAILHSPHYTVPLLAPCSTVVTFHDMTFFLYPQMHLLYKRLFFRASIALSTRRADALIASSNSTREDILRLLKLSPGKVFTVPLGVAPFFQPEENIQRLNEVRNRYNLPSQFILYVGNFEPRKNLPVLLRAFAQIVDKGMPHGLVLVGARGWKDTEVFITIEKLGLADRICFPGFVAQLDLPVLYSLCSTFVYPSLYEGFGLPVLEAMACGAPVITSNVSSMPEVAGDAGVLVDPNDVEELGEAMKLVLTDSMLRARLAVAGRTRAKLFSWQRAARETLGVYQSAVQAR